MMNQTTSPYRNLPPCYVVGPLFPRQLKPLNENELMKMMIQLESVGAIGGNYQTDNEPRC